MQTVSIRIVVLATLAIPLSASAGDPFDFCLAKHLTATGKYAACMYKSDAKGEVAGVPSEATAKCESALLKQLDKNIAKALKKGVVCPVSGPDEGLAVVIVKARESRNALNAYF